MVLLLYLRLLKKILKLLQFWKTAFQVLFFPSSEPELICFSKIKTFHLYWSFYSLSTSPFLKSYSSVTWNKSFLRQGRIIRPQAFGSSLARSSLFQTDLFSSRIFNISVFSNILCSDKGLTELSELPTAYILFAEQWFCFRSLMLLWPEWRYTFSSQLKFVWNSSCTSLFLWDR